MGAEHSQAALGKQESKEVRNSLALSVLQQGGNSLLHWERFVRALGVLSARIDLGQLSRYQLAKTRFVRGEKWLPDK